MEGTSGETSGKMLIPQRIEMDFIHHCMSLDTDHEKIRLLAILIHKYSLCRADFWVIVGSLTITNPSYN